MTEAHFSIPYREGGFQASILRSAGTVTMVLRGELDMGAALAAQAAVEQALREPADDYVLDLADLTFVDARGVVPFIRLAMFLADRGRTVRARYASPNVAFVFSLTPVVVEGAQVGEAR